MEEIDKLSNDKRGYIGNRIKDYTILYVCSYLITNIPQQLLTVDGHKGTTEKKNIKIEAHKVDLPFIRDP